MFVLYFPNIANLLLRILFLLLPLLSVRRQSKYTIKKSFLQLNKDKTEILVVKLR